MERLTVLLIEDNPGDARLIQDMLADAKTPEFSIDWKKTLNGGLESYLYLAFLVIQSGLVLILDYYGKKTVYS